MTRVLVTGACGLLGSAARAELGRRGAEVVATDVRASDGILAADLTSDGDVERLLREAPGLDALVLAHGAEGPVAPVERLDVAAVAALYDVNVLSVLRLLKAAIPRLRERGGGRVVVLASGAGLAGTASMAAYSSSKHAVVGLVRSAARELAADGISVNAVCPGCVESPMMDRIGGALGVSFEQSIPAGRYASPEEVAGLVAYLALEAPPYLTGAALVVDGALRA